MNDLVRAATLTAQSQSALSILAERMTQTANVENLAATSTLPAASPTVSPSPTLTPMPPTATATNTPQPTTATLEVLTHPIHFRRGGTSAYFQDKIHAGESLVYTLRAAKGQTLLVTATSEHQDVFVDIVGLEDGSHLVWTASAVSYWFGTLPKTQTYQITLTTNNPDTLYFLSVEIPANIHFETGAYSAKVNGDLDILTDFYPNKITRVRYLAYASAGQTMTVTLTSPNLEALSMGIIGQADGQSYLNYQVKNSGGMVYLPLTQGYYLDVYATGGKSTEFTLEVTIK